MIIDLELKLAGSLPVNREELIEIVSSWGRYDFFVTPQHIHIEPSEPKECYPLENLDVSQINDLSFIFATSPYNGDLSKWNVSNTYSMSRMFYGSKFDNDSISNWDVSNCIDMSYLFYKSDFNGDLSEWKLNNLKDLALSFGSSKFNNNSIKDWDISNVKEMIGIFSHSNFDKDISNWCFNKDMILSNLFNGNENFKNKYNNGNKIPEKTFYFLEWFENNKNKIRELNQDTKEEVMNFFSFNDNNLNKENNEFDR